MYTHLFGWPVKGDITHVNINKVRPNMSFATWESCLKQLHQIYEFNFGVSNLTSPRMYTHQFEWPSRGYQNCININKVRVIMWVATCESSLEESWKLNCTTEEAVLEKLCTTTGLVWETILERLVTRPHLALELRNDPREELHCTLFALNSWWMALEDEQARPWKSLYCSLLLWE